MDSTDRSRASHPQTGRAGQTGHTGAAHTRVPKFLAPEFHAPDPQGTHAQQGLRSQVPKPRMPKPQVSVTRAPKFQAPKPHARQASGAPVTPAPTYAQQRAEATRRRAEGDAPITSDVVRSVRSVQPARAVRSTASEPSGSGDGPSPRVTKTALMVAAAVLALVALGFCYMTQWRSIELTVNGVSVQTRVGTSLDELLKANDDFGKKPGRLLSVGGNVLDERGGDRAAVTVDNEPVAAADLAETAAPEGGAVAVADGADAVEPHTQEEVAVAPGLQMGSGGAIQYVQQWGRAGKKTVWHGERSGETVDHEVTEQPQDMVIASVTPNPQGGEYLALTFDDGPSKYTQAILDILKDKGAKATFFNLGTQAAGSPDLVRAVVDGGNELASHTNARQNLPTLDRDSLRNEISSAFDTLEQASGAARPQMMRAPYGAFTGTEWARSGDLVSCNVLWTIDTLDWKRPGPAAIKEQVLSNAYNGAIALMHDGGGDRQQDVEALPGIIDGLHKAGYELVTVSELMRLDGTFPEDVVNGTVKMPADAALPAL